MTAIGIRESMSDHSRTFLSPMYDTRARSCRPAGHHLLQRYPAPERTHSHHCGTRSFAYSGGTQQRFTCPQDDAHMQYKLPHLLAEMFDFVSIATAPLPKQFEKQNLSPLNTGGFSVAITHVTDGCHVGVEDVLRC